MTTDSNDPSPRSYGCTFGCGNPYDYIIVDVGDGSTQFLCVPCFVRTAADMIAAITEADDPKIAGAIALGAIAVQEMAPGPISRKRGKNAPATSHSAELFEAYDSAVTTEELPEEFR